VKIVFWSPSSGDGPAVGEFDVELDSGLVLCRLRMMRSAAGFPWLSLPSQKAWNPNGTPVLRSDGRQMWRPLIRFRDQKVEKSFRQQVLAALQAEYPQLFDGKPR